jgi:hypothetical protein
VDNAVAKTLAELESKLQELERALSVAVAGGEQQRSAQAQSYGAQAAPGPRPSAQNDPDSASAADARLVDERLEQASPAPPSQAEHEGDPVGASSVSSAPSPSSSSPPPTSPDDSIELAELVRFRERLEHAMSDLLSDYEQVIRLRGASAQPPRLDRS